ncbi:MULTISPECIES: KR domain-containing protein [unclassified Nocardiopsis]|uniref:KR domain-containing protein n=1 Tax=unclassified Nocardiopsis TaxID=2649073 RepID=UPI00135804C4|nr:MULTISPECIES: KR domain-containing protein [unclassified Nocardiopsis]
MTIAVTGATGHLGRLTIEHLLTRGVGRQEIVAFGRNPDKLGGEVSRKGATARISTDQSR